MSHTYEDMLRKLQLSQIANYIGFDQFYCFISQSENFNSLGINDVIILFSPI
jgi:hypothetical protein